MSVKRSAWMIPPGSPVGQTCVRWSSSTRLRSARPGATVSARSPARARSGAQPESESAFGRESENPCPAAWSRASAAPTERHLGGARPPSRRCPSGRSRSRRVGRPAGRARAPRGRGRERGRTARVRPDAPSGRRRRADPPRRPALVERRMKVPVVVCRKKFEFSTPSAMPLNERTRRCRTRSGSPGARRRDFGVDGHQGSALRGVRARSGTMGGSAKAAPSCQAAHSRPPINRGWQSQRRQLHHFEQCSKFASYWPVCSRLQPTLYLSIKERATDST